MFVVIEHAESNDQFTLHMMHESINSVNGINTVIELDYNGVTRACLHYSAPCHTVCEPVLEWWKLHIWISVTGC